jgi:Ca-activated chloride channel family protein
MIERPQLLWLLVLLPLFAAGWWFALARGRTTLRALGGAWRFEALHDVALFKNFLSFVFFLLFVVTSVFALSGFRWGEQLVEERRAGTEVVLTLDVSNSMLARDGQLSRLERSLSALRRLAAGLENARVALVVFKGQAVRLLPLSEDPYAVDTSLRYAGPQVMTSPGTGLAEGIAAALASLTAPGGSYQAVVLFSDGEYRSGNPVGTARQAGERGVPIYVVGVGSEKGAPVLLADGRQLLDQAGQPVISRLRADTLERIAAASGGAFYNLDGGEAQTVNALLSDLAGREEGALVLGMRREKKDRYRLFVFLSLLSLSLGSLVRAVRWRDIL